jgi:RNA polymerase-binding transcription factor DksA
MPAAPAGRRTDIDLDHYREVLEAERNRLRDALQKLDAQDETGGEAGETGEIANYDQHMADQGTELFLREQDEAIHIGLRGELDQVEAAWNKMQNGTYGYCERCNQEIPAERLEILPFAIYCLKCADELEARF